MGLTKDRALENAVLVSTCNPWHCFYFKLGLKAVAKTFVNSNRFYLLPTRKEYRASLHVHELAHIASCQGLPQNAFYIVASTLDEFGLRDRHQDFEYTDLMFVYNAEVVELLEALAYHLQLSSEATADDLRESIVSSLSSHSPARLALMMQIRDTTRRFMDRKGGRIGRDDLWGISTSLIQLSCATRNWVAERPLDRFRVLRNLSEKEIPRWRNVDEAYEIVRKTLMAERHNVVEMRRPAIVINNAKFLAWMRYLVRKMKTLAPVKPFVMGLLKELDSGIGPVSYVTGSLESLAETKIAACYLCANAIDPNFNVSLRRRLADIAMLLGTYPVKKSKENTAMLVGYSDALQQLLTIKKSLARTCRGPHACIGRVECHLDAQLSDLILSTWFDKHI
jgi:hypothetical protein